MGRKIGNFTNPQTGETDWLEPETVGMIVLQPTMVTKVGETMETPIDFKLDNIDAEKVITITAEYTSGGKKYTSASVKMNEEEFADEFAKATYADRALDESQIIIDAKAAAVRDLTQRLMDNNILTGGMQFSGLGFVFADEDRIMSIENLNFDYKIVNNTGIKTAEIKNCVSQASLKNVEGFSIVFYTGSYRVNLVRPEVVESTEGRLKSYKLNIADIVVTPDTTMPEHAIFENPNFENDEFLDRFITSRKTLLDETTESDEELDDRFGDLF